MQQRIDSNDLGQIYTNATTFTGLSYGKSVHSALPIKTLDFIKYRRNVAPTIIQPGSNNGFYVMNTHRLAPELYKYDAIREKSFQVDLRPYIPYYTLNEGFALAAFPNWSYPNLTVHISHDGQQYYDCKLDYAALNDEINCPSPPFDEVGGDFITARNSEPNAKKFALALDDNAMIAVLHIEEEGDSVSSNWETLKDIPVNDHLLNMYFDYNNRLCLSFKTRKFKASVYCQEEDDELRIKVQDSKNELFPIAQVLDGNMDGDMLRFRNSRRNKILDSGTNIAVNRNTIIH